MVKKRATESLEAPTERLVAYVAPTRKAWVERAAKQEGVTASAIVNFALAAFQRRFDKERR